MKKIIPFLFVVLGLTKSYAQSDNVNLEENFSLEGALEMFKKASSLEEFEKLINSDKNDVTNLDLNEDGNVDYINVESIKEGDTHVIILFTYLNDTEIQDIATIGIEKNGNENAVLQIEGDVDLFGEDAIAEPFEIDEKLDKSNHGPNVPIISITRLVVNVWLWPCVKFMYHPRYVVWKSPYRWKKYPTYWKPWKPFKHTVFKTRCSKHRVHYHRTKTHRVVVAKKIYKPKRKTAVIKKHKIQKAKTAKRNAHSRNK